MLTNPILTPTLMPIKPSPLKKRILLIYRHSPWGWPRRSRRGQWVVSFLRGVRHRVLAPGGVVGRVDVGLGVIGAAVGTNPKGDSTYTFPHTIPSYIPQILQIPQG